MFAVLTIKPDYVALSLIGFVLVFAAVPYLGQIDLTLGIAPTLETIGTSLDN